MIIDWHSHILPQIDDGSRNLDESIKLLEMLAGQGVERVIATPHFIADKESVPNFVKRRNLAFEKLNQVVGDGMPEVYLGAEVEYYSGISRLADLKSLCIENTNLLLLEMPISPWRETTVNELVNMATTKNVKLILAHIERMLKFQSSDTIEELVQSGILMQVNASFFTELRTRRKALSLLKRGDIQLIGSDCHNLSSRAPKMDKALDIIKKSLGEEFFNQVIEYGTSVLKKDKNSLIILKG